MTLSLLLIGVLLTGCSFGSPQDQAEALLGHPLPTDAGEIQLHRQKVSPAEEWYNGWMTFTTTEPSFKSFAERLDLQCSGGTGTFLVSAGQFHLPSWADPIPWWAPPAALAPLACGRTTDDGFIVAQFQEGRAWIVIEGGWSTQP